MAAESMEGAYREFRNQSDALPNAGHMVNSPASAIFPPSNMHSIGPKVNPPLRH
jgi:hypothetical protein